MYYSAIGTLALLVLVIENHDILFKLSGGFDKPAWIVYRRFLFSVLVYYVTDILWGIVESFKLAGLLFADTSIYFIMMAAGILLWTQYVVTYLEEKTLFGRFLMYAGRFLAAAVTLISILNIFTPILFAVDDKCVYKALPVRYAVLYSQIALLLLISLNALIAIVRRRTGDVTVRKKYSIAIFFGLIMALFLTLQIWYPYLPLYAIAYMLGTCLLRAFVIRLEKEEYRLENEEMKRKRLDERVREQQVAYSRISALAGDFMCVYIVDPVSEHYRKFSSNQFFDNFGLAKEGDDFFENAIKSCRNLVCDDDRERFLSIFDRETVYAEIERGGIYTLNFRIKLQDSDKHAQLKVASVEEEEGKRLVVGIVDIDSVVRREEEYASRLATAQSKADIDALTGVKNRHAYLDAEERLNQVIKEDGTAEFAVIVFDVNDLKKINDNLGHKAGDQHLREACKIICDTFKRSPVFRIGGDEFAVIAQGDDYHSVDDLVGLIAEHNSTAVNNGGVVVACGMSVFGNDDECVLTVFERADQNMYENKSALKSSQ